MCDRVVANAGAHQCHVMMSVL